jgi:hypothetical protein
LREKRPFKKTTPKYNAASGIIAQELLIYVDALSIGLLLALLLTRGALATGCSCFLNAVLWLPVIF